MNKFFIFIVLTLAICSLTVTASDWTSSISGLNLYIYEGMNFSYELPYLYFDDGKVYFNDSALGDYLNDTNETIRVDDLYANVSKWNIAYDWGNHSVAGYQTISNDKDTNLTGADVVGYVGNWSANNSLYQTILNDKDSNLTGADVVGFVGNYSEWDKDYNDLINAPSTEGNISFNQTLTDGLYRSEVWNNITGIPTATPSDGDDDHLSTANQIYDWVVGLFTNYILKSDIVSRVGNWSADKPSYQTIAGDKDTNLTGADVVGYVGNWSADKPSYQTIAGDKDTNLTGADVVGYVGNWSADKPSYQTIAGDKDTNLTGADVVGYVGNWSADKPSYQTIAGDKDTNLTGADVVGYVGNWSADKPSYQTIADDKDTNLTGADVVGYVGNFSAYDRNYVEFINITLNGSITGQPMAGSIGSGLISIDEIMPCGCINVTHNGDLEITYSGFTARIVSSDGTEIECVKAGGILNITDNQHSVNYIDSSCNWATTSFLTYYNVDRSPGNYARVFDVFGRNGAVEEIKGNTLIELTTRLKRQVDVFCSSGSHLSTCSGFDITEDTFGSFNVTSGKFVYLSTYESVDAKSSLIDGLHLVHHESGDFVHTNVTGINITHCDNGTDLVECAGTVYRQYPVYSLNFDDNKIIHQIAPLTTGNTYVALAACKEAIPDYTLPAEEDYVAVIHHIYCARRTDTVWDSDAWVDLRDAPITGGAGTPDLSIYQTILNDKDTNLTGADVVGYVGNWSLDKITYALRSAIVGLVGNWTLDKPSYQTIAGDKDTNLTGANVVGYVGNWSADKPSYQTIAGDKDTNLTGADVVGYVGNWSADKPSYQTIAGDKDTNLTGADIIGYVGNYSEWDKDYNDLINLPTSFDNESFNETLTDTLYNSWSDYVNDNIYPVGYGGLNIGNPTWRFNGIFANELTITNSANATTFYENGNRVQTIAGDKDTNLTGANVVGYVGNWSADKPSYQTIAGDKDTNLTGADVVGYVGNYSEWDKDYNDLINTPSTYGNESFNETLTDTLYIPYSGATANVDLGIYDLGVTDIYAKGDIEASANGGTTSVPRVFGFSDLSSNEAVRFQFGDEHNGFQNAYGQDIQIYSYWGIQLIGGMQNYNAGFEPPAFEKTTDAGVLIKSVNYIGDDPGAGATQITTLVIMADESQTTNITEWRDNNSIILSSVGPDGTIRAPSFIGDGSGLTGLTDNNLTGADVVGYVGNWSADKPSYQTIAGDKDTNLTGANVITMVGNYSEWDKNYNDLINLPTSFDNESFNETLTDTLYNSWSDYVNDNIYPVGYGGLNIGNPTWRFNGIFGGELTITNSANATTFYENGNRVQTIAGDKDTNLTEANIISYVGDWATDKPSYQTIAGDKDTNLTESNVQAMIFDNDNSLPLNMTNQNITNVDCIYGQNGGKICWI